MKRVLYITTVSRTINAFLIPHIEMLLENGYEVHCACSIDKLVDEELLNKGVQEILLVLGILRPLKSLVSFKDFIVMTYYMCTLLLLLFMEDY